MATMRLDRDRSMCGIAASTAVTVYPSGEGRGAYVLQPMLTY